MKVLDVDLFQEGLQRNISMLDRLRSEIEVIHRAVKGLVQLEDQLKGEGGDAIRSFYEECHLPFLQYFQFFSEHFKQVLHQMEAALYSLEPDSAGYIVEQFLEGELEQGLTLIGQLTANLTDETNSIMDQVRDIVGLPHLDDSGVQEGVINSKRKRDDTVARLHEFDATQTTALSPIEQGIQTMETWLSDLEGLYKDGLTDIHFQTNLWASLSSYNFLKTDLSQRTTTLADLSTMTDRKNHLKTMLQLFLAGASPIRFGYGGLIKPSTLLGHNILAFSSITAPIILSNKESMSELEMIYAELSKQPQLSNYHSDNPIDPITGDYMVTFEGKRKVMGGNGSGTPDGLAPFTMASYDFFLGDIATIVGPEATVNERIEAAAFTFVKPLKVADTGHDLLKAGENAKDARKGTGEGSKIVNNVIKDDSHFLDELKLKPNVKYETNGYRYQTDDLGRIERASGELALEKGVRDTKHQLAAGGEDRVKAPSTKGDHGGHLIGTQFNGSPLIDNIVAMNGNVNVSAYKKLEYSWAKALKEGQQVSVDVKPIYEGQSLRPSRFEIKYKIDGKKSVEVLENIYGGK
ncbi:T7SS effector LXG polymorphic toxin [Psychrobacillus sp. PGGUH221]|uniref:T7SS effector LXG polymorphic toxin n=1 Tax=Psychrobacillus sp. PGGUH221 TaxID=3020058 RepID=UPI0035C755A8